MLVRQQNNAENKKYINVLIVEDSEDDALLLLRQLVKSGFAVNQRVVDNWADVEDALVNASWDIIISDHNLPNFSSSDTLELVKNHGIDTPVIIVSGSIGEEIAVAAMRTGANDYIMKSNLARLVPAVQRELKEAENRKAHREAELKIRHMAHHDALTGLTNRYEFERKLVKLLELDGGHHHALMYIDLDQFKIINDTSGHTAGDELLRQLAHVLKHHVRDNDTLARLGGDEFGMLLERCPLNVAEKIAGSLLKAVKEFRFSWKDKTFSIGASIGLVIIDGSYQSVVEVLSAADVACYTAKDLGRNRVYLYHHEDDDVSKRKGEMEWVSRIDLALEQGRFKLYKQNIVSLAKNADKFQYCEFLLRMIGQDGELILPGAFIPAAERYNLMLNVDRWVINRVLEHVAGQAACTEKEILAFINLSGTTINDTSLAAYIREQILLSGVDPGNLCFEITETAAISSFSAAFSFIEEIRSLGCKFALDDFGSGMSSFSYLKALPVDFLKIDGEFVRNLNDEPMNKAIVEAINNIGHKAGLKTIGEYAETEILVEDLREIGLDFAQGTAINEPHEVA